MTKVSRRQRFRKFVSVKIAKLHHPRSNHLGAEKAGPSSNKDPQNSGTDGGPLVIAKSMSAEIGDSDEFYRASYSSADTQDSNIPASDGELVEIVGGGEHRPGSFQNPNVQETPLGIMKSISTETKDDRGELCGDNGSLASQTPMITVALDDTASVTESVTRLTVGKSFDHEAEKYLMAQESTTADLPKEKAPLAENTGESMSSEMKKLQKLSISTGIPIKKPPLRILSLDGNGVRVMSQIWTLRKIMQSIRYNTINIYGAEDIGSLRPSDFFDIIAGSSTGGLIAIMLVSLEMRLDDCMHEYQRIAPKIFAFEKELSSKRLSKMSQRENHDKKAAKFSSEPLEAEIKEMVVKWLGERAVDGTETKLRVDNRNVCKTFLCVRSAETGEQVHIRSYEGSESYTQDYAIWQACRAVLAEPTLFDPITLGPNNITYIDSGIENHNPIRAVMDEAPKIWGESQEIGCIVSIGTGFPGHEYKGKEMELFEYCLKSAAANEAIADAFDMEICDKYGFDQKLYWRFNVPSGLEEAGIPELDHPHVLELASFWHWKDIRSWAGELPMLLFPMLKEHYNYLHTINRAVIKGS